MSLALKQSELLDRMFVRSARIGEIVAMRGELSAMMSEILAKLVTISAEEEVLNEENKIDMRQLQELTTKGEIAPVQLLFDDGKRTIRWEGGAVKLSKNRYQFVKVLYQSDGKQMVATKLEEQIWDEVGDKTLMQTFYDVRDILNEHKFPYMIDNIKKQQWEEVLNEGDRTVKIDGTATVYKLIAK